MNCWDYILPWGNCQEVFFSLHNRAFDAPLLIATGEMMDGVFPPMKAYILLLAFFLRGLTGEGKPIIVYCVS